MPTILQHWAHSWSLQSKKLNLSLIVSTVKDIVLEDIFVMIVLAICGSVYPFVNTWLDEGVLGRSHSPWRVWYYSRGGDKDRGYVDGPEKSPLGTSTYTSGAKNVETYNKRGCPTVEYVAFAPLDSNILSKYHLSFPYDCLCFILRTRTASSSPLEDLNAISDRRFMETWTPIQSWPSMCKSSDFSKYPLYSDNARGLYTLLSFTFFGIKIRVNLTALHWPEFCEDARNQSSACTRCVILILKPDIKVDISDIIPRFQYFCSFLWLWWL